MGRAVVVAVSTSRDALGIPEELGLSPGGLAVSSDSLVSPLLLGKSGTASMELASRLSKIWEIGGVLVTAV